jgi:hypothetical protein
MRINCAANFMGKGKDKRNKGRGTHINIKGTKQQIQVQITVNKLFFSSIFSWLYFPVFLTPSVSRARGCSRSPRYGVRVRHSFRVPAFRIGSVVIVARSYFRSFSTAPTASAKSAVVVCRHHLVCPSQAGVQREWRKKLRTMNPR